MMYDYFLVGFGLGGMALAARMEAQGKSICVFEDDSQYASRVAGGMLNPINLKRFKMAWQADEQLAGALPFYRDLEKKLTASFFRQVPVYRRFASIEEQNNWFAASDEAAFEPFLDTELANEIPGIKSDFRFGKMNKTHLLNTEKLLQHYTGYLKERHQFSNKKFDYRTLEINPTHVLYQGQKARHVIFSEGMGVRKNPFFKSLPIQGNKGEYLIIEAKELQLKAVLKSSFFILPLGNNLYKVGATYDREATDQKPSEKAKRQLIGFLENVLDRPYKIVDQIAGIRPTLPDRRPVLGRHPQWKRIWVCNGFGSRGTLIAPAVSRWLLQHIQEGTALPEEVRIERFKQ